MGTRCLTEIVDDDSVLCTMYRQYDGYLDGHGKELADFLKKIKLINRVGMPDNENTANGMECLATQIIAHFKQEPGGIYLMKPGVRDCGEEYVYIVSPPINGAKRARLTAWSGDILHFDGTCSNFTKQIKENAKREEMAPS